MSETRDSSIHSVSDLLARPGLQKILSKIHELKKLTLLFQAHLTQPLAQHCQVANYHEGTLIVQVDGSTWGTLLHYNIPELLKQLPACPEFLALKKIKIIR